MKAVVLGSGGWGTALALTLLDNGHDVTLWSHSPEKAERLSKTRENPLLKGVPLPEPLHITGDLSCLEGAALVVSPPPSPSGRQGIRPPPIWGRIRCWSPSPRALSGTPTSA